MAMFLKESIYMDRDLLENILKLDNDEIELQLEEYGELEGRLPKKHKRYNIESFI